MDAPPAPPPEPAIACHYQGDTYSAGAIQLMGRFERVCSIVDGVPTWVRG